ncbi:MAG: hypothetical protein JKY19_05385 [Alcanivoracaceae bacterium]|nr:hypothetical protein [Alcanivoracaceae bacterium]
MFFLVRKSVLGSRDELQDLDFDVDELIIGSGHDSTVILDGLMAGALSIKALSDSHASFNCTQDLQLIMDNSENTSGTLNKGEIYQLGIYDIEVINAPAGFDFAINIIQSNRKSHVKKSTIKLKSRKSRLNLRIISYLAFISIILLFLLIPIYVPRDSALNKIFILSDKSWSSGPLAMAHRIPEISNDCQVCHVKPFEKVQDQQCLNCHRDLGNHVAENHPAVAELQQFLCQNCHKEHNEPPRITRSDDALCINCHREIEKFEKNNLTAGQTVESVKGFNADNHPFFRLSLLTPYAKDGTYEWLNNRPKFDINNPSQENSHLKFSHMVHLDVEMVQDESTGERLLCDDCHQLKSDKEHYQPISMDKDCRSCHQLTFDVFNPDVELPHGDLRAATIMLQAHYIREFTDPQLRQKRARKKIRRIPGKNNSLASCVGSGLDCGRAEALKEAEFQFNNSGCITCHEVTENDTPELLNKWFVKPIRINDDWYSKAHFDHSSHFSVKGQDKEEICLSCHEVQQSEHSSDIAMPQRNKCLECHQQGEDNTVELSCIRCHVFHFTKNGVD